jgi:hypothetical protein
MGEQLEALRESLLDFQLQGVVLTAGVIPQVVVLVGRATHQRGSGGGVDVSRIGEPIVKRTTLYLWYAGGKTHDGRVINVVGRPVAGKHVRTFVTNIGGFDRDGIGHLVLNCGIPCVQGR